MGLKLIATGRALPKTCVPNAEFEKTLDTSDKWIFTRTGISQRHFCDPASGENNTALAAEAARRALEKAGIVKEKIGAVLVATMSPDYATPSTACLVQAALGLAEDTACLDVNAACSGFVYALAVANGLLSDEKPYAIVVGSEYLQRLLDFSDRTTCILFGDGAGAAVVQKSERHPSVFTLYSRGDKDLLWAGGPGSDAPLQMDGKAVFRFASEVVPRCIEETLTKAGRTAEEVDHIVCHQANARIIEHVVKKTGISAEKFFQNIARYGNTSGASIPLALDEMAENGLLTPGKTLLLVGFGGGLTWAGALLQL